MDQSKRIRIKDIAQKAGTSTGTVDRVLHNRGEVNKETRKKILNIVNELDYKPNLLAKSLASKKAIKIAALIPDFRTDNPYWQLPSKGLESAQNEIKDFNVQVEVFTFEATEESSFIAASKHVLANDPDGVLYIPVFKNASRKFNESLNNNNIPFIYFDINLDDNQALAYFGQDAWQSGYIVAKLMNQSLEHNATVHIMNLANRKVVSHHLQKRENGFLNFFEEHPEKHINIVRHVIDILDPNALKTKIENIINKGNSMDGIFVTGSRVYKVAEKLELLHLNPLLMGYDMIQENVKYLKKDIIDCLITQNPGQQGYNGIMSLFRFLTSNTSPKAMHYSPIDIIIKENIDYNI